MPSNNPEVLRLIAQAEAVSTALACLDVSIPVYPQPPEDQIRALRLVQACLTKSPAPTTVEDRIIQSAMSLILSQEVKLPEFHPTAEPPEQQLFEIVAHAWMIWAAGEPSSETLADLSLAFADLAQLAPSMKGGALHLMALQPWRLAVEALLREDNSEAVRQFHRSSELGSQFGTETNPAIQWTYAASFFPR